MRRYRRPVERDKGVGFEDDAREQNREPYRQRRACISWLSFRLAPLPSAGHLRIPQRSREYQTMRVKLLGILAVGMVLVASAPARADATLFFGSTTTPSSRLTRGFAAGVSLLIVGFEFEYANTGEQLAPVAPSLRTSMGNAYVQMPFGTVQFYALLGGGVYRERSGSEQETSTATAIGGGAKVGLAGPLKLRLDYRLFNLRGKPRYTQVHRVYAGLNLTF
jgi:opacity protein-like surface antigen